MAAAAQQFVNVGDNIPTEPGYLRGHGTQLVKQPDGGDVLMASVSGFVERVNKLVTVRPLNSRYQGEVGDVIVSRVREVGDKVWRVDVNSRQNGMLMLSSVNLPGGVQRRRTHEDSLQMRNYFTENDLISAEVQKLMHDGAISLHTRNEKYGKLENGQFLQVPPLLIKRCKQHFHSLPCGVDIILGNNGYVWVQATPPVADEDEAKDNQAAPQPVLPVDVGMREKIARVRNSVVALVKTHTAIHLETLMDVYEESISLGLAVSKMLNPETVVAVTRVARARHELK